MADYLILGGWVRSKKSYRGLVASSEEGNRFLFLSHKQSGKLENILSFLNEKNIRTIDIIGHSTGGAISIEFSNKYPQRVNKLYLVDCEGIYGNETITKILLNLAKSQIHYGHKKLNANLRSAIQIIQNPKLAFKTAKYAHFAHFTEELKSLTIPVVILWGERDTITPLWQGQVIRKLIKGSKLIILRNMDHDWILHKPSEFWNHISV